MVFDYSGFGNSSGEARIANLHEDGLAAWHAFRERLPGGAKACVYGLSLGSGVLLEVSSELQPAPDCTVISGAFLSARKAAVRFGRVKEWQSFLIPDVLDSLDNVPRVKGPLFIEHGSDDEMFPPAWAEQLKAAHPGAEIEIVKGMHHADPVVHPSAASWDPVIRFVNARTARR
jgi:fermentation-respiration switch protein FrsA (DUF1100 family)